MINMNAHMRWFNEVTDSASGRAAATTAGISVATLNRQLAKKTLTPEVIIALARGYHVSPVNALVDTEYLRASEVRDLGEVELARLLTDHELIRETARRINDDDSAWAGTFDEVVESAESADDGQPGPDDRLGDWRRRNDSGDVEDGDQGTKKSS